MGPEACAELSGQLDELAAELKDVVSRGKHAQAIIANLLQFASSHDNTKEQVDITEVMDRTLELARSVLALPHGLRFSDLTIERDYDQDLPSFPLRFRVPSASEPVASQLLCPGGCRTGRFHPTLRIRILECYDALWVKVSHNGRGLTSEEQQYLFEPYFGSAKPDASYDAGKRLSFSYFIVTEHHNGQMAVTSDVNVGSTFHMQFQLNA